MGAELDLTTVLLLQKASYIAGALAIIYMRMRAPQGPGGWIVGVAYLVQAVGSTIAGMAENAGWASSAMSLVGLSLGILADALLMRGLVAISRRERKMGLRAVLVATLVVTLAALLSGFFAVNAVRAAVYNGFGGYCLLTAAIVIRRDRDDEPLPARRILAAVLAAAGLLNGVVAVEFARNDFALLLPAEAFFLIIIANFMLALFVIILEVERTDEKLIRLANTDPLTGLDNRRCFFAEARGDLLAGDAVVVFDIDHFKTINDRFGHAVGDRVLAAVAGRIGALAAPGDSLARYGGEEFVMFLPATSAAAALALAEKVRETIAATPVTDAGFVLPITISGGVAFCKTGPEPLQAALGRADRALYRAKDKGRDRIEFAG